MEKKKRKFFLRSRMKKTGIFFFSFFLFMSCKNDLEKIYELENDSSPELVIKEPVIIRSISGRVDTKVAAPSMKRFTGENPYSEFPEGVFITFCGNDKSVKSTLSAKYGISKENENMMEARNNVIIIDYGQGDTIYTEQVIWNQNTDTINSDKPLKRINGENITYGDGFVMDAKTGIYYIPGQRGNQEFEDEK